MTERWGLVGCDAIGILEKSEATMLSEELIFARRSCDRINVFSTFSWQLRQGLDVCVAGV